MLQVKDGGLAPLAKSPCSPLRVGIIGMGGFAGRHHETLLRLEAMGQARLLCTCDPALPAFAAEASEWQLAARGVRMFDDYRSMLAVCGSELDVVVVPTPIHLHAQMHADLVALGIPVYLEKPPTLDYAELESMIAVESAAAKATLVAFHFIVEKPRLELKRRLLAGEFGQLRAVTLKSVTPRAALYFERNNWAGRLLLNERIVLDSCFGNAMAHYVHNVLFWAGQRALHDWAQLHSVRAQLFRAHRIEGADTFFVEAKTTDDVLLRIGMTHVWEPEAGNMETLCCDKATIYFSSDNKIEIHWKEGGIEVVPFELFDGLVENHLAYYAYLRGLSERPATTLADSRSFVFLNDLAHISSGRINAFPDDCFKVIPFAAKDSYYLQADGLDAALDAFLLTGQWPPAHWGAAEPQGVGVRALGRLRQTLLAMRAAPAGV